MFQDQKMVGLTGVPQLNQVMTLDYLAQEVLCGRYMEALQH
jgi:hypothetical protein